MDWPLIALLVFIPLALFLLLGFYLDNAILQTKLAQQAKDLDLKRKRLAKELDVLRLENNIEAERLWAQVRPARVEARAVGFLKQRDEGMLDWMLARKALDQLSGGAPRTIDGNPLASSIASLREEIENRKADGDDSDELLTILNRLRTISGS